MHEVRRQQIPQCRVQLAPAMSAGIKDMRRNKLRSEKVAVWHLGNCSRSPEAEDDYDEDPSLHHDLVYYSETPMSTQRPAHRGLRMSGLPEPTSTNAWRLLEHVIQGQCIWGP